MREGSTYIVLVLISGFSELLELWKNNIVCALSVTGRTHHIIHFLTAIDRENNIAHLLITELHDLIIEKKSIGRKCEAEFLIVLFFLGTSISDEVFYNLPVHGRLTTEEVDFKIGTIAGISNQKI